MDAAAVFDLLRRAPVPERLAAVLEVESGANDPVAVLLTRWPAVGMEPADDADHEDGIRHIEEWAHAPREDGDHHDAARRA